MSDTLTTPSSFRAAPASRAAAAWQRIDLHGVGYAHWPATDGRPRGGVLGVSLSLRRGERLALVGPAGCGKSTLLRVLAGRHDAQFGHITVDGVARPPRQPLRELTTLIPQEAEVFAATVRQNLLCGLAVEAVDLRRAVQVAALDEVLAALPQGLDTVLAAGGANLSAGQRQRLALARGVLAARHSSLLLLDEPTSSLDPVIEATVQQRLGSAFAGACLVAAVHRLSLLPQFDRVALMVGGRIVDVGSAAELEARQPLFADLCAGRADARAVARGVGFTAPNTAFGLGVT